MGKWHNRYYHRIWIQWVKPLDEAVCGSLGVNAMVFNTSSIEHHG